MKKGGGWGGKSKRDSGNGKNKGGKIPVENTNLLL